MMICRVNDCREYDLDYDYTATFEDRTFLHTDEYTVYFKWFKSDMSEEFKITNVDVNRFGEFGFEDSKVFEREHPVEILWLKHFMTTYHSQKPDIEDPVYV